MKNQLKKMLKVKEERKKVIVTQAEASEDVAEVRSLHGQLKEVDTEIRNLQEMLNTVSTVPEAEKTGVAERTLAVTGEVPGVVNANSMGQGEQRNNSSDMETALDNIVKELRSGREVSISPEMQKYVEKRSISSSSALVETKYSRDVKDGFNAVPRTIDLVDAVSLDGGNDYQIAFYIGDGEADYTAEEGTYKNDEGTWGTVSTGRAKITNSAIVSEEVLELSNINYLSRIIKSVKDSIRTKISKQIPSGAGGANKLKGIYNMPATLIPANYKTEISEIDEDTLRNIVFSYGGDEDLETPATLMLNKKDLAKFASIKAADGRPYYEIGYAPKQYIKEVWGGLQVPYTINSGCNDFESAAVGDKTMLFGNLMAYELPMFSPLVIKQANERYIDKGQIGFFGHIFVGGAVNRHKAFLPIVKGAPVTGK